MLVELFVLVFLGIFIGISQSAGIGGGTIINVLLIVGLGYNAKESIIITYIFLMGGGLASTLAGLKKKTPQGKRVIDNDLVMITLPMVMSGAIFGTILNHYLSEMLITAIFIILMVYMLYTTYGKYLQAKQPSPQPLIKKQAVQMQSQQSVNSSQQAERLEEILSQQASLFPIDKLKIVGQIYLYTIVILLCRGGQTFDSWIGLERCSFGSWILAFLHLFLSYLYSKSIAIKQFQRQMEKESLGFTFEDSGDKMSEKKMRDGIVNGFLAGLLGACISIGGGMVLLPLWFRAGIDKSIATSSTGPLIFFSASISFFISALLGKYDSFLLVIVFFLVSFTGSYVIKNLIFYLIEKYKFKSLVIVLLLFLMVVSLLVFLPTQLAKYQSNPTAFMQFDILC